MDVRKRIFDSISKLADEKSVPITDQTKLIGTESILDSMKLVQLCLALEDLATEYHFQFDWTSETALSQTRGMFRTAGALADTFIEQMR